MGAGFASADRFLAELSADKLRPGYIFVGDEAFHYERCRRALIAKFVPSEMTDFCLHDLDLADNSIFEALDAAQTPSLMAPFQLIFVRGLKALYGRGAKKDEFAAIDAYFRSPNPQALVILVADHLRIPSDVRRMDMEDKTRYERIRETLGDWCGIVECAHADEEEVIRWLQGEAKRSNRTLAPDAARELADSLGGDLLLLASEWEKLLLYTGGRDKSGRDAVTQADVELLVTGAKQRSLYELTDAISRKDKVRALALLEGLLNASEAGEDAAIGHLYMLARTFRQMLVILEKNVRDSRAIWGALWQGFRLPPFAADDVIRQARRYKRPEDLMGAIRAVAQADLAVRSNPVDKKLVLERLVLELATPAK
jgi:DNA polymerase-3 subunit delta